MTNTEMILGIFAWATAIALGFVLLVVFLDFVWYVWKNYRVLTSVPLPRSSSSEPDNQ